MLLVLPIPGPFDEIIAIAGIAFALRDRRKRQILIRYLRTAWRIT